MIPLQQGSHIIVVEVHTYAIYHSRTLFAGNLELNITDEEMRRIFGRYGELVDIDIKRPPPGTGNAFAFVRFKNLDMAAVAKKELSGQYIGKFQCKIGYGKANATTKIWIGGLGPWCTRQMIEREFDRFGAFSEISYKQEDGWATIQYESIDAATTAVNEMRGFQLGENGHRIRMDFADVGDVRKVFLSKSTNIDIVAPRWCHSGVTREATTIPRLPAAVAGGCLHLLPVATLFTFLWICQKLYLICTGVIVMQKICCKLRDNYQKILSLP